MLKEATSLLERKEEPTGVNAICYLNLLYSKIDEATSAGLHSAVRADFAASIKAEIKKKFNKQSIFWYCVSGFFDPKKYNLREG